MAGHREVIQMPWVLLVAALAAAQPGAAVPLTRSVTLSVYTKKAVPVDDLRPEEIVLSEGGQKRSVLGVERDSRPLDVALVIDTAAALAAAYRSDLVPAVTGFWKALPAGSGVAVWSTAPAKVADFGAEVDATDAKLRMIAAAGGNYGFDSMVEGCKALRARGAPRRALVYVGGGGLQTSRTGTSALMEAVGQARATPMIVLVLPAGRDGVLGGGPSSGAAYSWDVQGYFAQMSQAYFGSYVEALSTLAVAERLRQAAADLNGQYQVRFQSEAGPGDKLKVEVKRKDVRFRVGRSRPDLVPAN
jgi:hypothetical protein